MIQRFLQKAYWYRFLYLERQSLPPAWFYILTLQLYAFGGVLPLDTATIVFFFSSCIVGEVLLVQDWNTPALSTWCRFQNTFFHNLVHYTMCSVLVVIIVKRYTAIIEHLQQQGSPMLFGFQLSSICVSAKGSCQHLRI